MKGLCNFFSDCHCHDGNCHAKILSKTGQEGCQATKNNTKAVQQKKPSQDS